MKDTPDREIEPTFSTDWCELSASGYDYFCILKGGIVLMVSMVMFASTPTPDPQPHSAPVVWAAKGVPSEFVIGALVPPILLGLFVSRALADIMTQAGLVSEQLYRGERLPTLHISSTESTTP